MVKLANKTRLAKMAIMAEIGKMAEMAKMSRIAKLTTMARTTKMAETAKKDTKAKLAKRAQKLNWPIWPMWRKWPKWPFFPILRELPQLPKTPRLPRLPVLPRSPRLQTLNLYTFSKRSNFWSFLRKKKKVGFFEKKHEFLSKLLKVACFLLNAYLFVLCLENVFRLIYEVVRQKNRKLWKLEKLKTTMKKDCFFGKKKRFHFFKSSLYESGKVQIMPLVASRSIQYNANKN